MKFLLLIVFSFFVFLHSFAQNKKLFHPISPIDSSINLAGTFGELRNHHFHAGLDIRTGGKEGMPVYAVEDAVLKRIKVSSYGNGKALYLDHQSGYSSVYCHLRQFNSEIQKICAEIQRKNGKFEFDTVFEHPLVILKKGEIIGLSGNSGGSEGPHLHFEIRNTRTEEILNPELLGIHVPDSQPPVIGSVKVFTENGIHQTYSRRENDTLWMEINQPCFYWAAVFKDGQNAYEPNNFPYEITLIEGNHTWYSLKNDYFAFNQSRIVDGSIVYPRNGDYFIRIPALPNTNIPILSGAPKADFICLNDTSRHFFHVHVSDATGNARNEIWVIKNTQKTELLDTISLLIKPRKDINLKQSGFEVTIPDHVQFQYTPNFSLQIPKSHPNNLFALLPLGIPFSNSIKVFIPNTAITWSNERQIVFTQSDLSNKKTIINHQKNQNGWTVTLKETGKVFYEIDSVAPETIWNFSPDPYFRRGDTIHIITKELLSGIKNYSAHLNGLWVHSEYEYKTNRIWVFIPENISVGKYVLDLKISDACGNETKKSVKITIMALPQIGHPAPAFAGKNQKGEDISLAQFHGKKVLLYFYPKDDTPGCTAEACNLRDNYSVLLAQGWEVIGVSTDSVKSHDKFANKYELPFHLLADEDKNVVESYGVWIEKSMYGRKYMGTDRKSFVINEEGILTHIIEKVDTKNHTQQILDLFE